MNIEATARPELVFALVGPAGTRLKGLSRVLKEYLRSNFAYQTEDIHLSDLLPNFTGGWTSQPNDNKEPVEFSRIRHRQSVAYKFRQKLGGSALALAGIASIREKRRALTGHPDKPASARAYVLDQLKHPEEVELLRRVYGPSLILLAGHAPEDLRKEHLAGLMAGSPIVEETHEACASQIIHIDTKEDVGDDLGQNTRDTYPLADFFADLALEGGENALARFIDLLFGHPFHTPTPHEMAMYQARAVSLRSSDESRQVGAVIVELTHDAAKNIRNANVVASGMNEVPRRGGGFYWQLESPDGRDQALMYKDEIAGDLARQIKIAALEQLIQRIRDEKWLIPSIENQAVNQLANKLLPRLGGTHFMNIGEFSRPVHAEMAALIDAARRGVAVHGRTMFVTTFPCHNCAKHIVAAGLEKIVYLEPYPKSRARQLYKNEINLDPIGGIGNDERVVFAAYNGVAPRQYGRLFSMSARGRKKAESLAKWEANRTVLTPRYVLKNASGAYLVNERDELNRLPTDIYAWNKTDLCPNA